MPRVTAKLGPHGWLVCNCRLLSSSACWCFRSSNAHGVFDTASTSPRTADIPKNCTRSGRTAQHTCHLHWRPDAAASRRNATRVQRFGDGAQSRGAIRFICSMTGRRFRYESDERPVKGDAAPLRLL